MLLYLKIEAHLQLLPISHQQAEAVNSIHSGAKMFKKVQILITFDNYKNYTTLVLHIYSLAYRC